VITNEHHQLTKLDRDKNYTNTCREAKDSTLFTDPRDMQWRFDIHRRSGYSDFRSKWSWVLFPAGALSNHQIQLSLPSLRGR